MGTRLVTSLFLHPVRGSAPGVGSMARPGFPDPYSTLTVIKLQAPEADIISAKEIPEDFSSSCQNARVFCDQTRLKRNSSRRWSEARRCAFDPMYAEPELERRLCMRHDMDPT